LRGWRLVAIDGFEVDLPDTGGNAEEFGYAGLGCEPVGVPEGAGGGVGRVRQSVRQSGPNRTEDCEEVPR
jgi:hypothetical protein